MTEEHNIKALIKKRGSYKGQLTSFVNYLATLDTTNLDSSTVRELQLRSGRIESLYEQFDSVQLQIECESDTSDIQLSERSSFESLYFNALAKAQEIYSSYNDDNKYCSVASNSYKNKLVKLPTIQLPKFSGSYENWLEFKDTFTSLIHANDAIEIVNKFHYLRSSLEGSAAVVLQSVEFSASNYELAWTLLCERYDNKRLLIQNHVSSLFDIVPITRESSIVFKNLIDQLNKNLRSLKSLGEPVEYWDTLLIHIVSHKLDSKSLREWEEHKVHLDKNKSIKFTAFLEFIRNRADLHETLELNRNSHSHSQPNTWKSNSKLKSMISMQNTPLTPSCPKCRGDHHLNNCSQFLSLSNNDRKQSLLNIKVCHNCLRPGHYANQCKKTGCKICLRRHNYLIHIADFKSGKQTVNNATPSMSLERSVTQSQIEPTLSGVSASNLGNNNNSVTLTAACVSNGSSNNSAVSDVLLSTALVRLYDCNNYECIVRAVLDSGSTSCLMTNRLCEQLNLPVTHVNKSILGINNSHSQVGKMCQVRMTSLKNTFNTKIQCFILPSITDNVPNHPIDLTNLNIPSDICLADPNFYEPSAVDLIIGADVFWDILGTQRIKLGQGQPILHETSLGWLISGTINSGRTSTRLDNIHCHFSKVDSYINNSFTEIQSQLSQFWQLEEVSSRSSYLSTEEKQCEEHFIKNTTRLANGRFCVKIPLKESPQVLGESLLRAKRCLISLENRIVKQPSLHKMYKEFMSEYISLGHMTECSINAETSSYFIPHHGVLRENSITTKLRVVFNASSPSSSGISLNNIQIIGPTVQDDLLSILLRFRFYRYILNSDVEKMYRQVMVAPEDRYLQQIVWRENNSKPFRAFQLNTVTYGTANAPFLATRCLKQLGLECLDDDISKIIIHDFYVDDLLTGSDNYDEAMRIRHKVTSVLASACMHLRKWRSNEPALIQDTLDSSNQVSVDLNIGTMEPSKTLGLGWLTQSDCLCFPICLSSSSGNSKREIVSTIGQIFDPLGLLAPCIVKMKMLLQKLWLLKLSWDEQLPPELYNQWVHIFNSLHALSELNIPRRVVCNQYKQFEMHIFCDASERAYGACLYVRSYNDKGDVIVNLLMAKSRVAPIKPVTIPRLELCAALVGARLYEKIKASMRINIGQTIFWSDSMVVLNWLRMLPSKLQPFVRNRVAEILEVTDGSVWRHVPTSENPADLISRGMDPESIKESYLWWSGPSFLKETSSFWPIHRIDIQDNLPETRQEVTLLCNTLIKEKPLLEICRFSSYLKLQRTVAFVHRYIYNFIFKKEPKLIGAFSALELQNAMYFIIRIVQNESFPEYTLLLNKKALPNKSSLLKFNVFLDEFNIMRVGGRLCNSNFPYDKKFPIVLQSTHHFTKLLFTFEHQRLLHAGPQLLLASIRESYWPIGGRNLAKVTFHKCVLCCRMRGKTISPQMGNLPINRVLPGTYAFQNVGIDYAGPIHAASRQGRGCKIIKVYIAIFICLTTKCVHIELVGDLTSNCFLLALRRFISRRGKPLHIYSDNGTSFVGAYNELSKFLQANCNSLSDDVSKEGITFHFIPAYTPHFGGLWEAGVKSIKFHLVRVMGNCHLTYEELNTTLTQIEAVLNSRPLTPLSSDPEDFLPLTPGHFLIGRSLTSLPESDLRDHYYTNLTRYHRIEQLRQHFWSRWSKEYVAELQQRVKWLSNTETLKLNSLILVKEDNMPPLKWKLGRVVAVYPGTDGISRVADIRTSNGVIRRAFTKICPLPEED